MAERRKVFTWVAYDSNGDFLGFMVDKARGSGLVTVYNSSGKGNYIDSSQIASYEIYSVQALNRLTKEGVI